MLHALILDRNRAGRFAAVVVHAMIRQGADPATMRRHQIPTSVFYGVFGGGKHRGGHDPVDVASDNMRQYRRGCLGVKGAL